MATITIIGMGYLGTHLAELFLNQGHHVIGVKRIKRDTDPAIPNGVHMRWCAAKDLTLDDLTQTDQVIYCAAPKERSIQAYQDIYFKQVEHCLNLCKQSSRKPHFFYLSSTAVMDENQGNWVNESTPCQPNNEFSQLLYATETNLSRSQHPTTIFRCSGIYGNDRHYLLKALIEQNVKLCFDTRYSNRIHIHDLSHAIVYLMQTANPEPLYLLSDSEPTPINTIVAWLSSTTGISLPEQRQETAADPSDHKQNKRISNQKLIESGYTFAYPSFKQGFKQILMHKKLIDKPS